MTDPSKINIKVVVEEVQPRSMEVRQMNCNARGCLSAAWQC